MQMTDDEYIQLQIQLDRVSCAYAKLIDQDPKPGTKEQRRLVYDAIKVLGELLDQTDIVNDESLLPASTPLPDDVRDAMAEVHRLASKK